ncbi:MAG: hypothetical protein CMF23_10625 [Ignavibacteriae bacterium]|nr:hypothetical protein [Ignavibacteriota bacterium]
MQDEMKNRDVTLTDHLSVLFKWKKFIIINLIIISAITTGITFLIPEYFKATTTVMIQDSGEGGLLSGMVSDLGGVFSKAFGGGGDNTENKLFGFLNSTQFSENIIDKFKLTEYYEFDKYVRENTLKAFKDDFKSDLNDNGFIEVSMVHKDPQKSAEIANYAVGLLVDMNQEYAKTYATKYREFVEKRYFQNMQDLKQAEFDFEKFQKKYKIYAIPEQLEASFSAYAELEKELALDILRRDVLSETQGKNNPNYRLVETQVNLMKDKIEKLKKGEGDEKNSLIFIDLKNIPEIQKNYLQIKRELEVQTKLLEFTLPMYEQAVMEEQKSIPAITVIDEAVAPELKDSPKKALIILSIFFLALFFQLPIIFRGYKLKNNTPKNDFEKKEKKFYEKITSVYGIK